jgi:hypothetical protein
MPVSLRRHQDEFVDVALVSTFPCFHCSAQLAWAAELNRHLAVWRVMRRRLFIPFFYFVFVLTRGGKNEKEIKFMF